jgi:two-component system, cell cycle sensor histidine kinase and response regulator CckA
MNTKEPYVFDLEEAVTEVQLGLWEYEEQRSRFVGTDMVFQILGLGKSTEANLTTVSQLYVSEPPGVFTRAIDLALKNGKPFSLVSEITQPSGQRKWVRTRGRIAGQPGTGSRKVFGTIQDISEFRLLDKVNQESVMTLAQVEMVTHIGHFSVNLLDGTFFHSDEIKRIFGYEPSEYALSVEDAINAYHEDDREELLRLFNRAVTTGEGYEFNLRVVQPSREIRHVHSKGYTERDATGKVIRVYGVFQDITDRVLAERALRESEASLNALVDSVHTAIVVHAGDGSVLLSNQMANRLLAPLTTHVVGKSLKDPAWRFIFEDGQDVPVDALPVSVILRTRAPIENLVMGRRSADAVVWLLVNGVPVVDKNGVMSKIIISFVDITEHKEMEERLRQAEKLKAIGQLAGGVAHDFNNQLMVMSSCAEMLKARLPRDAAEQSFIEMILSGVSRSAQLTRQLLAFARKGKYVVTAVDLNTLVYEVESMARHSFDKKIRIANHVLIRPATIAGDSSQLQNALLNMALNSRDAMPRGGDLVFTTNRVTLDNQALKTLGLDAEPGAYVKVSIRDTGIGMDEATKQHLFEPFFTTKGVGKGTGMGLASVYGTVKNHHGAITVESELGTGTTISMYFPHVLSETGGFEGTNVGAEKTGHRILIVDDESGVTRSLSMLLNTQGYETTTCSGGFDALDEFKKSWRNIDMVLLDMIMPDMGGAETFHALKAIDPDVKVVLISGYSATDETDRVMEAGASGFLQKPVAAKDLWQTVSDTLQATTNTRP